MNLVLPADRRMTRFKDYSLAAYNAGIVKLGGVDGDTWIALADTHY